MTFGLPLQRLWSEHVSLVIAFLNVARSALSGIRDDSVDFHASPGYREKRCSRQALTVPAPPRFFRLIWRKPRCASVRCRMDSCGRTIRRCRRKRTSPRIGLLAVLSTCAWVLICKPPKVNVMPPVIGVGPVGRLVDGVGPVGFLRRDSVGALAVQFSGVERNVFAAPHR